MSRWKAAGIHLLLSIALALAVGALLFFVWYPGPLFAASGGDRLVLILIGIDIAIGPLLTLVVFRAGKRGLKFDLAVIALLQVAALLYGLHVISAARPAYLVFAVDRIVAVSANQLEPADLARAQPGFDRVPWTGPRLAYARMPTDATASEEILMSALRGKDLERFPQYYEPYQAQAQQVVAKLRPLDELTGADAATRALVERAVARSRTAEAELGWLPLVARSNDIIALVRRADASIAGYVEVDPWRFANE